MGRGGHFPGAPFSDVRGPHLPIVIVVGSSSIDIEKLNAKALELCATDHLVRLVTSIDLHKFDTRRAGEHSAVAFPMASRYEIQSSA